MEVSNKRGDVNGLLENRSIDPELKKSNPYFYEIGQRSKQLFMAKHAEVTDMTEAYELARTLQE